MAGSSSDVPAIRFESPTFHPDRYGIVASGDRSGSGQGTTPPETTSVKQRTSKWAPSSRPSSATPHQVYLGSFAHTTPRGSIDGIPSSQTPQASPRASTSHVQLEHLLPHADLELDKYGVEELRDGFFDAAFYRPLKRRRSDLMRKACTTLPKSFERMSPLSFRQFLPQQLREFHGFITQLKTREGIKLLKSFLGVFIAYIICLIPISRDWLGRYNYIMVLSAIMNHPGRAIGSQLDGALLTILGTFAGLGWGSLALYVSTSTQAARSGYGGVLATFLVMFTAGIGFLRCVFIRAYQAVIPAGIAICYICLANTSQTVGWRKVFDYGIPWVLGQAICFIVACIVFPTAGALSLGAAVHESLLTVMAGLNFPRPASPAVKRDLAFQFVKVSGAVRDFLIEFTFSRFRAAETLLLRNLIQGVIRSILAIESDTTLFDSIPSEPEDGPLETVDLIRKRLGEPSRMLLVAMRQCIKSTDAAILNMAGLRPPSDMRKEAISLKVSLTGLVGAEQAFDEADNQLLEIDNITMAYKNDVATIELFLFIHPLRQAASKIEALANHVSTMQSQNQAWRIQAPSYPWYKAINRTNAQVRHDRGGLTAGFYFRTKHQLERSMADLQRTAYVPAVRHETTKGQPQPHMSTIGDDWGETEKKTAGQRLRYETWSILHRLQGFESRFAFKVSLVTTLLSVPAWLPQSRGWWNTNESWWTVVTVWLMMHPRVGGNVQDLFVRCLCAIVGAVWAGLAFRAGNGNPYVMAVFAAIFLVPMLHRFTQSSHPRSGIMSCFVFSVISLDTYTAGGKPSAATIAWTRGLAFVVGIVAAVTVNWILWPFIARHELRKSLSTMMLHSAILYRGVIAKYVYPVPGHDPGAKDAEKSEMLEGQLREGFLRLRQLLELTRHEIRLRAPFNPLPYSALLSALEAFFENLIRIRLSALYFRPSLLTDTDPNTITSLTAPRRDAVAAILMNMYILACALRSNHPVPRYLPSAPAARKVLLDRMAVAEAEFAARKRAEVMTDSGSGESVGEGRDDKRRRWADVYHYAYSSALTDIVEELQQLQRYTTEVCGEVEWG